MIDPPSAVARASESDAAASFVGVVNGHIFQLSVQTILCAHAYGHIDEASVLRVIARALRAGGVGEVWID